MTYTITYLCNVNPAKFLPNRGYVAGDPLMDAGTTEVETDDALTACERAFMFWNRDDRPNGATAPSLSMGDVVRLDREDGRLVGFYECAEVGFEPIDQPEPFKNARGLSIVEALHAFAEPGPKCPDCGSDDIITGPEFGECGTCGLEARAVAFDPEGQKL